MTYFLLLPIIEQSLNNDAFAALILFLIGLGFGTVLILLINSIAFLVDKLGDKITCYQKLKNSLQR